MLYSFENFLVELGARIKQLRRARGWSLRTMVVDHGFHLTHWQKFEKGKISLASLLRVCQVFDIRLETLIADLGVVSVAGTDAASEEPRKKLNVSALEQTGSGSQLSNSRRISSSSSTEQTARVETLSPKSAMPKKTRLSKAK